MREDTKIYLDNLETQYVTTTQLSNMSGSSSNLQSQINTKMNIADTYSSITINSLLHDKLDVAASAITTTSLLGIINTKVGLNQDIITLNISCNNNLYFKSTSLIYVMIYEQLILRLGI